MLQGATTTDFDRRSLAATFDAAVDRPAADQPANANPDQKLSIDQQNLRALSGFYLDPKRPGQLANDDETEEEKKRKERFDRMASQVAADAIDFEALPQNLALSIDRDRQLTEIGRFYQEVRSEDMLRDANGNIVATSEQKREMEAKDPTCSAKKAQDEVTLENGKLIEVKDFHVNEFLKNRMNADEEALKKVQSGEMKADQLPSDTRDRVLKIQQDKEQGRSTEATFLDRVKAFDEAGVHPVTGARTPAEANAAPAETPDPSFVPQQRLQANFAPSGPSQ